MAQLLNWFLIIITFFLGFTVGMYKRGDKEIENFAKSIKKSLQKRELGAVHRPTAQDLLKKGTVQEETDETMSDTFDKILSNEKN